MVGKASWRFENTPWGRVWHWEVPQGGPCLPMEDINLHFTGDMHAVTTANNLLSALIDNAIHHREGPALDPRRVTWRRVIDMNDRALRNILVGTGAITDGVPRQGGFDITAASEVMAALCLAEGLDDLKG